MVDELPASWEHRLEPILERLERELDIGRELAVEFTRNGYQTILAVAEANPDSLSSNVPDVDQDRLAQIIERAREIVDHTDLSTKQTELQQVGSQLYESGDTHLRKIRRDLDNQSKELKAIREAYFGPRDLRSVAQDIGMACRRNELIPFIGSGFSLNVNADLPDWNQLTRCLIEALTPDKRYQGALRKLGSARVAELYINQFGRKRLFKILTDLLHVPHADVLRSAPHIHLATMRPQRIYTTNYDCFIEKVFSETPTPIDRLVRPQDISSARGRSPQLVKLHGSLNYRGGDDFDAEDIVISESDFYSRIRDPHPFETLLQADILGKSLLFIGYSFSDPNIGYLWNLLSSLPNWTSLRTSYFIDYPGYFTDRINIPMAEYLASRKIMLISPKHEAPDGEPWDLSMFLGQIAAYSIGEDRELPMFLTPQWMDSLQKAHNEKSEAKVKRELYKHPHNGAPLRAHRKACQELLKDIVDSDYSPHTRSQALRSLQHQLETFANDERGINFQTQTIDDVGLFIMQCIYDDDLRATVESFILNQSHQVKHALFNEFIDDFSLRRDSIPQPEPALTMMQMIYRSSSMHLLFQRKEVKESLETLEERFPDHQSDIGRTIQLTTR